VNDKSANFLAIYYKVLKHERSLSVTEPPCVCLPFLTTFVPVNLPTLTTQVLHYLFSILSHIFTLFFVNFYVRFTFLSLWIFMYVLRYLLCCYISSSPSVFILHFYDFSVACCQPFL